MRLLGVDISKRATQFVPAGLDLRAPSSLVRSPIWGDDPTATLPVIYACLQLLTARVTAMPMRLLDGQRRDWPIPLWLEMPSPSVSGPDLISQIVVSLVQRGNAYLLPVRVDGHVAEVFCVSPDLVEIHQLADGRIDYIVAGQRYDGELVHGRYIALPGRVKGLSAWDAARKATEIGMAAQDFVRRHFDQSAHLQMAVIAKGAVEESEKQKLAAQLRARHVGDPAKAWAPLVLDNDVEVKPISMTADQAKFVELTQMTDAKIASQIYRVDPSLVGITQSGTSLTYSNLVDREAQLYRDAIRPIAARIEQMLGRLLPHDLDLDFDHRELLRGTPRDRAQLVATMKSSGAFTINELREVLGYPAIAEGESLCDAGSSSIVIGDPKQIEGPKQQEEMVGADS